MKHILEYQVFKDTKIRILERHIIYTYMMSRCMLTILYTQLLFYINRILNEYSDVVETLFYAQMTHRE